MVHLNVAFFFCCYRLPVNILVGSIDIAKPLLKLFQAMPSTFVCKNLEESTLTDIHAFLLNLFIVLAQVDHHDLGHQQAQQEAPKPQSRPELRTPQLLESGSGQADTRKMLLRDRDEAGVEIELGRASPQP